MRNTKRLWLILLLAACLAALACDSDDDDDSGDDTDDDDADDDDSDDDDDDDNDDDDSESLPPLTDVGWMLLCDDREHAEALVEKAAEYGANRVVLSHEIIEDMDEIPADADVTELVAHLSALAHSYGMKSHVWVHELTGAFENYVVCFDPQHPYWDDRAEVYREALLAVPDIDGVNVTMGSGNPAPWLAMCLCQYCLDLEPYGHIIADALNSHPDERIRLVMNTIAGVATDELGREVVMHTFHHQGFEVPWIADGLIGDARTDYRALIKDTNHDWQPYYPTNSLFGNVGARDQIISFDLGGEYWGQQILPFCMVEQIQRRLEESIPLGVTGANARVERGCNQAVGTPGEVNLYALSRLAAEPDMDTAVIWSDWMAERYSLASASADLLTDVLRSTFDVGRKMYYVEGFWVFTKGSDFPSEADKAEKLIEYSNTKWSDDWQERFDELQDPTADTVRRIWQEKTEAVDRAGQNLATLEGLQGTIAAEDYDDLHARLRHQWYATRMWRLAADIIWRYQLYASTHDSDEAARLEGSARALSALADEVEAELGSGNWPARPSDARDFIEDLREKFDEQDETLPIEQMVLSEIRASDVTADSAVVTWTSDEPASGQVEYGTNLPLYGEITFRNDQQTTEHSFELTGLAPRTHYYFRVRSVGADGIEIVSGDYRFRTRNE